MKIKHWLIWLLLLFPASAASGREIVINAVGDIMLGGKGTVIFNREGYGYPFTGTSKELKNGDITVGNLEAPISDAGTEFLGKRFRFRTGTGTATALRQAGFSVVTLANNHIMDFGEQGLRQTMAHLANANLLYAGAGLDLGSARRAAIVQVKGQTVAFLAYSLTLPADFFATATHAGTAPGFPGYFRRDIASARKTAKYVVVSFHWGSELATVPKAYQIAAAHAAIDAGADLVLGHHPHVLQGIERYKKGVIMYSLGNFAFASTSLSSDRSVIARITLDEGVKAVEIVPLNVLNKEVRFRPAVLRGARAKKVIARLNALSEHFGTVIVSAGNRYLVDMQRCADKGGGKNASAFHRNRPAG